MSYEVAHRHLKRVSYSIKNQSLLGHLEASVIMMKSLYKDNEVTKETVTSIKSKMENSLSTQQQGISKAVLPLVQKQTKLEAKLDKMSGKLDEVQTIMEHMVSILIGDDSKKGEIMDKLMGVISVYTLALVVLLTGPLSNMLKDVVEEVEGDF